MKHFRYLDNIPYKSLSEELKLYVYQSFDVKKLRGWTKTNYRDVKDKCPNLKNMLDFFRTDLEYLAFIVYHKYDQSMIHIDHDNFRSCRLIIPIENCEGSTTCYYTSEKQPKIERQVNGIPFYHFDEKDCKLETGFEVDKGCHIFRTDLPHRVVMSPEKKFPRITCTIATHLDLSYLLV